MQNEKTLSVTKDKFQIGIFPNYFKKIGISILILFFFPALIFKLLDLSSYIQYKILLSEITTPVFIVGLFFIAWSKEKSENSYIHLLRYRALAIAFSFSVGWVLIAPLTDFLFEISVGDNKATDVVINMLLIYLFVFYITKKVPQPENYQ
jgi:hypothetical protein